MHETKIEKLKNLLSGIKLKKNSDYSILFKNGHYHLLCHEIFRGAVQEHAKVLGIEFSTIHTIS